MCWSGVWICNDSTCSAVLEQRWMDKQPNAWFSLHQTYGKIFLFKFTSEREETLLRFWEASAWDLKGWHSLVDRKQKHQEALKELHPLGWDGLRFTVWIQLCSKYSRGAKLRTFLNLCSVASRWLDQQADRAGLALFSCLPKVKVHVVPELTDGCLFVHWTPLRQHYHSGIDSSSFSNSFSSFSC